MEFPKSPQEEATELYNSLPDEMKTGHFGLVKEEPYYTSKEEAERYQIPGREVLPYILVEFDDGRKIELHLSLRAEGSFEEQIEKLKKAAEGARNIEKVEAIWRP